MPYCGHLVEVTFTANGPKARSCEPPTCFRNPKGWTKASSVTRKKTAIGWIFKQLLGCTALGAPEKKMQILPPTPGILCPHRIQECVRQISLSCIGEGNGNPLQCSCLENPTDRGAFWAAVYGVTQSRTRLKRLSSSSSSNDRLEKT